MVNAWALFGRATGAQAISLRTLEFAPGLSPGMRNAACDEVLYVVEGSGIVYLEGIPYEVEPETDRKSTRLNSSHSRASRMPSSA